MRETSDYQPSPELSAFLARGPKPVYVGFGSMTSGDMGKTLNIVLGAQTQRNPRGAGYRLLGRRQADAAGERVCN